MQRRVYRVKTLPIQEWRCNQFGSRCKTEETVPKLCVLYAGTLYFILLRNFLLQRNQYLQELWNGRKITLHLVFWLVRCVLIYIAVPRILSIIISDGWDIVCILLQKSSCFYQVRFAFGSKLRDRKLNIWRGPKCGVRFIQLIQAFFNDRAQLVKLNRIAIHLMLCLFLDSNFSVRFRGNGAFPCAECMANIRNNILFICFMTVEL